MEEEFVHPKSFLVLQWIDTVRPAIENAKRSKSGRAEELPEFHRRESTYAA
jgi:hypothetical protein